MPMISVSIIANYTDLGTIIGLINWFSAHRTHDATYISLEHKYDCTINDQRKCNIDQVIVIQYFP